MSVSEALAEGLQTTVLGLSIVFSALIIIMLVLYAFKFIFAPKKQVKAPETAVPAAAEPETIETEQNEMNEELIAVLTAAAAASLNTSTYKLQIKSYRRVSGNTPAWNKAGVEETITARF